MILHNQSKEEKELYICVGRAIVLKEDIKDIIEDINDYESLITVSELSNRGNFQLMNMKTGKCIEFEDGRRINKLVKEK